MKAKLRLLKVFCIFGFFVIEASFFQTASNQRKSKIISKYASRLLKTLQIHCYFQNTWGSVYPGLMVSNHVSYIDILLIAKLNPALFITSQEVRQSFGIGWMARLAGCVFVERRNRSKLGQETKEIEAVLRSGTSVVLFPEGTSTDGHRVLNFHAALFQSAMNVRANVHNFYIQYDDPTVAYYGDDQFFRHLYRLCERGPMRATLKYLGETNYRLEDDRKTIARMSYEKIVSSHISGIRRDSPNGGSLEPVWASRSHC